MKYLVLVAIFAAGMSARACPFVSDNGSKSAKASAQQTASALLDSSSPSPSYNNNKATSYGGSRATS